MPAGTSQERSPDFEAVHARSDGHGFPCPGAAPLGWTVPAVVRSRDGVCGPWPLPTSTRQVDREGYPCRARHHLDHDPPAHHALKPTQPGLQAIERPPNRSTAASSRSMRTSASSLSTAVSYRSNGVSSRSCTTAPPLVHRLRVDVPGTVPGSPAHVPQRPSAIDGLFLAQAS
jgi:hypothetical protein